MTNLRRVWTWNVAGRTTRLNEQADRVLVENPDVVCLQEVTPNSLIGWKGRLQAEGYEVETSLPTGDALRGRRLGVVIASRHPMTSVTGLIAVPWPERLLGG